MSAQTARAECIIAADQCYSNKCPCWDYDDKTHCTRLNDALDAYRNAILADVDCVSTACYCRRCQPLRSQTGYGEESPPAKNCGGKRLCTTCTARSNKENSDDH